VENVNKSYYINNGKIIFIAMFAKQNSNKMIDLGAIKTIGTAA
jgi:hypothetical protein